MGELSRPATAFGKGGTNALLRARAVVREVGIPTGELTRVPGTSNEVWIGENFVVRISTSPISHRLENEAALLPQLPPETLRPAVFASGRAEFGDWIVVERRAGGSLSDAWPKLDNEARRRLTHQMGWALRALHHTRLESYPTWPPDEPASLDELVNHPYRLTVGRLLALLGRARQLQFVDASLIDDVGAAIRDRAHAFEDDGDENVPIVHGDFHLENVLTDGENITALVDFEWARSAPSVIDLSVMLRFCSDPELHVGATDDFDAHGTDYRDVPGWLREVYSELFSHPHLEDRLFVSTLAYDIRDLLRYPPLVPPAETPSYEPQKRMKALLSGRGLGYQEW